MIGLRLRLLGLLDSPGGTFWTRAGPAHLGRHARRPTHPSPGTLLGQPLLLQFVNGGGVLVLAHTVDRELPRHGYTSIEKRCTN
jgi:hypothetical protein